mmetsp:Transcript_14419/g.16378  ORF Transcript_14419/g.16378 Transcript_14419/m.16378 type:complete len:96 (-) Transcript_14419:666-953(-)
MPLSAQALEATVTVKNVDMSEDKQRDAIQIIQEAMGAHDKTRDVAAHIKKEFDQKYEPSWNCIVGRDYGSYVTHESGNFLYCKSGNYSILLFKSM